MVLKNSKRIAYTLSTSWQWQTKASSSKTVIGNPNENCVQIASWKKGRASGGSAAVADIRATVIITSISRAHAPLTDHSLPLHRSSLISNQITHIPANHTYYAHDAYHTTPVSIWLRSDLCWPHTSIQSELAIGVWLAQSVACRTGNPKVPMRIR